MKALPDAPADHEAGTQRAGSGVTSKMKSGFEQQFYGNFDGILMEFCFGPKILVNHKVSISFSGCQVCLQVSYLHMQRQRQVRPPGVQLQGVGGL